MNILIYDWKFSMSMSTRVHIVSAISFNNSQQSHVLLFNEDCIENVFFCCILLCSSNYF